MCVVSAQTSGPAGSHRYKWFVLDDVSGFFGLAFDNLTVLSFLAGILIVGFQLPSDVVYTKMFPGTALGVLVGDLIYTWLAFRLARRTGSTTVTAMPLGLDTPSTIGLALTVLGPSFVGFKAQGMSPHDAAIATWHLGTATMVMVGVAKVALSFAGPWVRRVVPQAGLLGSLAGIGLALLGYLPLVEVFGMPIVGMAALGLILYAVVAKVRLPMRFPGVLAAVLVGSALYYLLAPLGLAGGVYTPPALEFHPGLPLPSLAFLDGIGPALKYLPIAIPFGLLTVIGGINVTESARVAGDDFDTREILLTEAVSTLVAGVCGGVAQSTPYIGQPAFKQMGSRAGYTLLTGLFIGLGGILGYASFVVELIPRPVIAPILVFVAIEIVCQAFVATPKRHAPAVAFSFFPIVARLAQTELSNTDYVPAERFQQLLSGTGAALPPLLVTVALGNGFILTAMLWGAFVAKLVDRALRPAAIYALLCAVLTFFGVIHSALPDGTMYLPWTLPDALRRIPYQFTAGYVVLGLMFLGLSFTRAATETAGDGEERGDS
jgi:AGZA family xanthine/uracil permease-like MFS transporter